MIQLDRDLDSPKQSGFEVSPRPPTPPKALDDEDVKPTTIDLGQTGGRSFSIGDHPSSILKHSAQGVRFNFKNIDARQETTFSPAIPHKSGRTEIFLSFPTACSGQCCYINGVVLDCSAAFQLLHQQNIIILHKILASIHSNLRAVARAACDSSSCSNSDSDSDSDNEKDSHKRTYPIHSSYALSIMSHNSA
ncbi:unnamed protein product [Onchocerca flexuosa]|uniref:FHA domain-containing protein n=1 Tax=Onchocerca flexuosa TaxID=387005 RepID=A0A183I3X7_9BILA|nr:unnamed protein product [Onchocerca flexuosa]